MKRIDVNISDGHGEEEGADIEGKKIFLSLNRDSSSQEERIFSV